MERKTIPVVKAYEPEVDEIKKALETVAVSSSEHESLLRKLTEKLVKANKFTEQILVMPSRFNFEAADYKKLNEIYFKGSFPDPDPLFLDFYELFSTHSRRTFLDADQENPFSFQRRNSIEYDVLWKQIGTFAVITDGVSFAFRKSKKSDKLKLFGGHVDFSVEAYMKNQEEFLRFNMIKELGEETNLLEIYSDTNYNEIEPWFILNNPTESKHDIHHLGVIFLVVLTEVEMSNLIAKEKKSTIVRVNKSDIDTVELHRWARLSLNHPIFAALNPSILSDETDSEERNFLFARSLLQILHKRSDIEESFFDDKYNKLTFKKRNGSMKEVNLDESLYESGKLHESVNKILEGVI